MAPNDICIANAGHSISGKQKRVLAAEDLEREGAVLLPERELMSIMSVTIHAISPYDGQSVAILQAGHHPLIL